MRVSGFTFVRNAVKFDYPVVESITSVLPLCDEFIVLLGNSEDNTQHLIESIQSPKIKIVHSIWDDTLRTEGRVLAVETDKALRAISPDAEWAFYIQADEVIHEKFHKPIQEGMRNYKDDPRVDGLLFHYLHFYGSYDYVGDSYSWYRKEVRIIRNNQQIVSYRDAQGFRRIPAKKLRVKQLDAYVYHYGWVRHPATMQSKQTSNTSLSFDDEWIEKNVPKVEEYDYSTIDSLRTFQGTHPRVMQSRIKDKNWQFKYDTSSDTYSLKNKIRRWIEKWTGWYIGEFRNYKIID